jgi:hypothetical protein
MCCILLDAVLFVLEDLMDDVFSILLDAALFVLEDLMDDVFSMSLVFCVFSCGLLITFKVSAVDWWCDQERDDERMVV